MNALVLPYDPNKVGQCLEILKSLRHSRRQKILSLICTGDAITVTALYKQLKLRQEKISYEMRFLRESGLVKRQRVSKEVHYSIVWDRFEQLNKLIEGIQ